MKKTYFAPQTEVTCMLTTSILAGSEAGDANTNVTNPNPEEEGGAAKTGIWED